MVRKLKFKWFFGCYIMIIFTSNVLFAQDKLIFTNIPDTIEYGKEFSVTCQLWDGDSSGNKIQVWNWYIVGWCYNNGDTLAFYTSDEDSISSTWSAFYDSAILCPQLGVNISHYAFLVVSAIDSEDNILYVVKKILIWDDPSDNPGSSEDDAYITHGPNVLSPLEQFTYTVFYDDADLSGTSADYWSWKIVLLSNQGFQLIQAVDSLYGHNLCNYSAIIDSIDLSIDWIYSETGTSVGYINAYVTTSDGLRYFDVKPIEYVQQPMNIENTEVNPSSILLNQNYPNPFNPSTIIEFTLSHSEYTTLRIYNILGAEVTTLVSQKLQAGRHTYQFNGSNLASGIYYYQVNAGGFRDVKKMILLR